MLRRTKQMFRAARELLNSRREFESCQYVRDGIGFYFDNKVHTCCYYPFIKENGTICAVDDPLIARKIAEKKRGIFVQHRRGNHLGCRGCPCFRKAKWRQSGKIAHVTLNHFLSCNLHCRHCGYMNLLAKDTKHDLVLGAIKELYLGKLIDARTRFDVGGGEPSIQRGLDQIIEYVLSQGNAIHINSNGTTYINLYARGCRDGQIALTLTPDAGSREVYLDIKGSDLFDQVWNNIARYVDFTEGKVEVKCILEEGNVSDAENMLKQLEGTAVRRFVLDLDLNVPPAEYPKYLPAIGILKAGCLGHGISIVKGAHLPRMLWDEVFVPGHP